VRHEKVVRLGAVLEDERCFAKVQAGSQLASVEESTYLLPPRLIAQTNLAPVQLGVAGPVLALFEREPVVILLNSALAWSYHDQRAPRRSL
jgi:hypothetical protein